MHMRGCRLWVLNKQLLNLIFGWEFGGGTKGVEVAALVICLYIAVFIILRFSEGLFQPPQRTVKDREAWLLCPWECKSGTEHELNNHHYRALRSWKRFFKPHYQWSLKTTEQTKLSIPFGKNCFSVSSLKGSQAAIIAQCTEGAGVWWLDCMVWISPSCYDLRKSLTFSNLGFSFRFLPLIFKGGNSLPK